LTLIGHQDADPPIPENSVTVQLHDVLGEEITLTGDDNIACIFLGLLAKICSRWSTTSKWVRFNEFSTMEQLRASSEPAETVVRWLQNHCGTVSHNTDYFQAISDHYPELDFRTMLWLGQVCCTFLEM